MPTIRLLLRALALGTFVVASPTFASAGGALIETTAPLGDRTDDGVKAAVLAAVKKAVRGAVAMGFPWFQLRDAQVVGDEVAVQIMATDQVPGEGPGDDGLAPDLAPRETKDGGDAPSGSLPSPLSTGPGIAT